MLRLSLAPVLLVAAAATTPAPSPQPTPAPSLAPTTIDEAAYQPLVRDDSQQGPPAEGEITNQDSNKRSAYALAAGFCCIERGKRCIHGYIHLGDVR